MQRTLAVMDKNGDKRLTKEELKYGMQDYGIDLNVREIDDLFTIFDRDRDGFINLTELMMAVRGDLNERRKSLVLLAFNILDTDRSGTVTVDEISAVYDVSKNPDFTSGKKTKKQAYIDFMRVWDKSGDGLITYEEFEDYYKEVSSSIDGDDYFELMIRNAWRISGGEGQSANTANRRVLVTDKNGNQSVQCVNDELGMDGKDINNIRTRLGRQGVDANNTEMYSSSDSRDKGKTKGIPPNRPQSATRARPAPQNVNPYSSRPTSQGTSRQGATAAYSDLAAERIRNGSRKTPNIILDAHEEMEKSETAAPRARNAFERHVAAMKLAAAYRGRIGRKKADTEKRKSDNLNQQREEEEIEANRPKGRQILRPKGKSYIGF
jgi:Ca2+-binding EF-hand superfamily protein